MPTQLVVVDPTTIDIPVPHPVWEVIEVNSSGNVYVRDTLSHGAGYEIDIVYDAELERFVAASVKVERSGQGHEVTSRIVRELTIQEIIADVALSEMTTIYALDEDGPVSRMSGAEMLERITPAAGRDQESVVDDALLVSALARLGNWPPLVTVADRLQVSHSTAKRLVARGLERKSRPHASARVPIEHNARASRDWLALASAATTRAELFRVWDDVLQAREMHVEVDGTSVRDHLLRMRDALPPAEEPDDG